MNGLPPVPLPVCGVSCCVVLCEMCVWCGVCVCVCVCVRACVRVHALRMVSMDNILRFTNTLLSLFTYLLNTRSLPLTVILKVSVSALGGGGGGVGRQKYPS